MKYLAIIFLLCSALYAQCPLGLTPNEACPEDNAGCTLYVDSDGDGLCDNPGPQIIISDEIEEVEEDVTEPDSVIEISEEPEIEQNSELFCPLNLSPNEACVTENPRCTFFIDSNSDGFCDNPGPQQIIIDLTELETQEIEIYEDNQQEIIETEDTLHILDTLLVEEALDTLIVLEEIETTYCPLGLPLDEACVVDSAKCTFFIDINSDEICDNPGLSGQIASGDRVEFVETNQERDIVIGCPFGLSPEAACIDSLALCPHWYGVSSNTTCANPAGGTRRNTIALITLVSLLILSTWISRTFPGKSHKNQARRNHAHLVIRGVSLMVLGFALQGCFCPLGTFQYIFLSGGLAFLGIYGFLILFLPILFSMFFGRIYCGWVCPMGALQEFLYKINAPKHFSPKGKLHNALTYLKSIILVVLVVRLVLNNLGILPLAWQAPFCSIDPFHTIFTLFLTGSLVVAGVTILLSIFIRRFFCRYLCFYGVVLSFFSRFALWNRLFGEKPELPPEDSDAEFDK